jgi:hypothetical protein
MPQVVGNPTRGIFGLQLTGLPYPAGAPVVILTGSGDPNAITDNSVTQAAVGSLYTDQAGGAKTTLYVRETTDPTTGWAAK